MHAVAPRSCARHSRACIAPSMKCWQVRCVKGIICRAGKPCHAISPSMNYADPRKAKRYVAGAVWPGKGDRIKEFALKISVGD